MRSETPSRTEQRFNLVASSVGLRAVDLLTDMCGRAEQNSITYRAAVELACEEAVQLGKERLISWPTLVVARSETPSRTGQRFNLVARRAVQLGYERLIS